MNKKLFTKEETRKIIDFYEYEPDDRHQIPTDAGGVSWVINEYYLDGIYISGYTVNTECDKVLIKKGVKAYKKGENEDFFNSPHDKEYWNAWDSYHMMEYYTLDAQESLDKYIEEELDISLQDLGIDEIFPTNFDYIIDRWNWYDLLGESEELVVSIAEEIADKLNDYGFTENELEEEIKKDGWLANNFDLKEKIRQLKQEK